MNKKTVLKVAFISIFFSFSCLVAKVIKPEDLHIFRIFQNAKVILIEDILQRSNKDVAFEKNYLAIVEQEISLLTEIVDGFNNGLLPLLEYKFWGICNFFKDWESIEPRNVRAFKRKIIKFDDFIHKSCLSKLNDKEIELCNRIISFDKKLLEWFLRHNFYNIGAFDEFADICFYRPLEWAGKHPVITTSVLLIISGYLFYKYIYTPYLSETFQPIDENSKVDADHPTLENKNKGVNVKQINVFGQKQRSCGAHALFRVISFHESGGDENLAFGLANNIKRFNSLCVHWMGLLQKSNLNDLHSGEIEILIRDYNHGAQMQLDPDDLIIIDDSKGLSETSTNFAETYGFCDSENAGEIQYGRRARFAEGLPQYFIVNTAQYGAPSSFGKEVHEKSRVPGWIRTSYGHWLPFMFTRGADGVKVLTADSIGSNRTNDAILNGLHRALVQDF